jgi:hypothetical protein
MLEVHREPEEHTTPYAFIARRVTVCSTMTNATEFIWTGSVKSCGSVENAGNVISMTFSSDSPQRAKFFEIWGVNAQFFEECFFKISKRDGFLWLVHENNRRFSSILGLTLTLTDVIRKQSNLRSRVMMNFRHLIAVIHRTVDLWGAPTHKRSFVQIVITGST